MEGGRELSLAHKQHFQAQEIALPLDMAPVRYLRVVYRQGSGETGRRRAGNRAFQQSDPCAQLIIRSWMARERREADGTA